MNPTYPLPTASDLEISLLQSAPVAIVVIDHAGQVVYANPKLEEMFGYSQGELQGQVAEMLMPERFRRLHVQHRQRYGQNPHVRPMGLGMDVVGLRKDGSEFPIEAGLSYICRDDEMFVLATIADISPRKQIELAQQQSEEHYRKLVDLSPFALFMSRQNRVVYASPPCLRLFGATQPEQLLGQSLFDLFPPRYRPLMQEKLKHLAATADGLPFTETKIVRRNGVEIDVVVAATCYEDAEEQTIQVILADITKRKQAEEALRMVAAEHNRIAHDLQDAVMQTLFPASLIAEALPKIWHQDQAEGTRRLEELRQLTRGALAEMRMLLLELSPSKLMEMEVADLLRQLAEATANRAFVPVAVHIESALRFPADVKVALYRIAQEALNNVAKHARAQHAEVRLQRRSEAVELSIADDGHGFRFEPMMPHRLGLDIMCDHATAIRATLTIQSHPGQGTKVVVRWPITDHQ